MTADLPLGKNVTYPQTYDAALLCPVPRQSKRDEIGLGADLPFTGCDLWNAYEISWLNPKGKPCVAIGEFLFPADSPNIIESKSFKLYLNSCNQSRFESATHLRQRLGEDLGAACGAPVAIALITPDAFGTLAFGQWAGDCIDEQDIAIDRYDYDPALLAVRDAPPISESLHSHLLKSNCLITGQPDWASLQISYHGRPLDREALLKYLVSFRHHNEFHEQCVERIWCDINRLCQPEQLTVYARYTRRGGLDINPWRSNFETFPGNPRLARQ